MTRECRLKPHLHINTTRTMKQIPMITAQDDAIQAILGARVQGPRAASYGWTILNRNPRVLRGIRKTYAHQVAYAGFTPAQLAEQWQQIRDMAVLEDAAE